MSPDQRFVFTHVCWYPEALTDKRKMRNVFSGESSKTDIAADFVQFHFEYWPPHTAEEPSCNDPWLILLALILLHNLCHFVDAVFQSILQYGECLHHGWPQWESNPQPQLWYRHALPTELHYTWHPFCVIACFDSFFSLLEPIHKYMPYRLSFTQLHFILSPGL